MADTKTRVVVLISGSGSNLQAIIDQTRKSALPIEIVAVISNKANAYGLQRAKQANIKTVIVENQKYPDRESYDRVLQQRIDDFNPDLVVLAGFMRILTAPFVNHYLGKMLNIHPSLLPNYRGLNTHQRVLDDRQQFHGASIHFVTPELDGGPVILQSQVAVSADDTAESLAKKVQVEEHQLYPLAINWFAQGRIKFINDHVEFDNNILEKPILLHGIN